MDLFSVVQALAALVLLYATISFAVTTLEVIWTFSTRSRSKHLRKGIETLIGAGKCGSNQVERDKIRKFTEILYTHPFIDTLTLEDGFGDGRTHSSRTILSRIFQLKSESVKTKEYEPSSIPSDVFITVLTEVLRLDWLAQEIVEVRLEKFSERILDDIKKINLRLVNNELDSKPFEYFQEDVLMTLGLFKSGQLTVESSIASISNYLDIYINSYEEKPENKIFLNQVKSFKNNLFGKEIEYLQRSFGLKPSLVEMVDAVDINSPTYSEISSNIDNKVKLEEVLCSVPESLINSLRSIARRSQENDGLLTTFYQGLDVWYSRATQSEDSIYKRKTRIRAFIISFFLVLLLNIDAFNFISTFTFRYDIRDVLVSHIKQQSREDKSPLNRRNLTELSNNTEKILKSFPSPIGWSLKTQLHQFEIPILTDIDSSEEDSIFIHPSVGFDTEDIKKYPIFLVAYKPQNTFLIFIGWLISAGAISMGGPFWLDLFSKFVNVKR